MARDEAGRRRQKDEPKTTCAHGRLVDYEVSADGKKTGNLICRECGAVFPEKDVRKTSN